MEYINDITYYKNGNIKSKICKVINNDGEFIHNNNGPAYMLCNEEGIIIKTLWFWYGVIMSFDEWIILVDITQCEIVELKLLYKGY